MKNILVAATPSAFKTMRSALENRFSLTHCFNLDAARAALDDAPVDLILCCTHFDESRMFDLLRYVKMQPALHRIPFMCAKIVEDEVSATYLQGVEIAARALGADSFIDFSHWKRIQGEQLAFDELTRTIHKLLG